MLGTLVLKAGSVRVNFLCHLALTHANVLYNIRLYFSAMRKLQESCFLSEELIASFSITVMGKAGLSC